MMKRKLLSLLLVLCLCLGLCVCVHAAAADEETLVYDEAGLLTATERTALDKSLQRISKAYNAQVLVVTILTLEDADVDEFVEYLYTSMDFGYGEDQDGVLLLVCMDPREFRILSNGFAASAITQDNGDSIRDVIKPDLSDGDYAEAFDKFAEECEYYLDGYLNGFPFDFKGNLATALIIGVLAGVIVAFVLKGQLKSVRKQHQANAYVKSGSMQLTHSSDLYLYRHVTRTKRESNKSSSGGGGGSSRNISGGSF